MKQNNTPLYDAMLDPDDDDFNPALGIHSKSVDENGDAPLGAPQPLNLSETWLKDLASMLSDERRPDAPSAIIDAWKPNGGRQAEAFYSMAQELFYGGASGGGKAGLRSALISTPFGWKKAGDLKRGDQICNPDGTVQRVVGVYDQGVKEFYKVTFIDGATSYFTSDHLMVYWLASTKVKAERSYLLYNEDKGLHWEYTPHKLEIIGELYKYHAEQEEKEKNGGRPYWILTPLCKPVPYTYPVNRFTKPHKDAITPYVMGILISEGSLGEKLQTISFASADQEIIDRVALEMPVGNVIRNLSPEKISHYIGRNERGINPIRDALDHFKLRCLSNAKFIPNAYLYDTIDNRIALAQGLIDGDGYVDDRGHMSYTTVSEQLAKDVQHLFRSLGCKATIFTKHGKYRNDDGEIVECHLAYNLHIQGEELERFVYLSRKKERCKPFNGGVSEPGRRIVSIEKVESAEAVCIAVDNPNGLYITDDFIVTHNSDLMVGLAVSPLSPHRQSIMFRSTYGEHKQIVDRVRSLYSDNKSVVFKAGSAMRFEGLPNRKVFEFGSVMNFAAAQKYKGRAHDLKLFDEVSDIDYSVYTFLIAWARSTDNVRVRIVSAGNPPTSSKGEWVIRRWAPWIEPSYPNPATPGELRYFATLDGIDTEITPAVSEDGAIGKPFDFTNAEGVTKIVKPMSRTFVPALLGDNPYLKDTDYESIIMGMPEPYRSQLLYGQFMISSTVDPWQVIPAKWIQHSVKAHKSLEDDIKANRYSNVVFGLDVSEGANDQSALLKLVNGRYVEWIIYFKISDLMKQADLVYSKVREHHDAPIAIDAIGAGLGLASRLKQLGLKVHPIKVSQKSRAKDATGHFSFMNLRSEMIWRLREGFNPEQPNFIVIPDERSLIADLGSMNYELTQYGVIRVQSKDEIRAKLGRSPDGADALYMARYLSKVTSTPLRMR